MPPKSQTQKTNDWESVSKYIYTFKKSGTGILILIDMKNNFLYN